MNKISAIYEIMNTVTNEYYVGSSKNVLHRWSEHRCPSTWKKESNKLLYQAFQKYGLDKFRFQILCPVMPEYLKQVEQELIEMIQPAYNNHRADGFDVERRKKYKMDYQKTNKYKEIHRKSDMKYRQSDKGKEASRKRSKKYGNQICSYNGEELTLGTLAKRFRKAGVEHPNIEAKKYLKNS